MAIITNLLIRKLRLVVVNYLAHCHSEQGGSPSDFKSCVLFSYMTYSHLPLTLNTWMITFCISLKMSY